MSLVKDLRILLQQSFLSLPLILIGWLFFMGVTQGNIAFLILALGHIFLVPLGTVVSNALFEFAFGTSSMINYFSVNNHDLCRLIPGASTSGDGSLWVVPSYWMAHIFFFSVFLLSNAFHVYSIPPADGAPKEKVNNRKTQVSISAGLTGFIFVSLIGLRYFATGCETVAGITVAGLLFGSLGYAWYLLVRSCSSKDSDIFGIVQGIKPESMKDDPPMTCVYQN